MARIDAKGGNPRTDFLATEAEVFGFPDVTAREFELVGGFDGKVVQSFQQLAQPNVSATSSLSERARKVLELLAHGYAYKEIGDQLGITVPTVGTHVRHIYDKLHVNSRAQAVAKLRNPSSFF